MSLKHFIRKAGTGAAVVTDWLLIAVGLLLVLTALLRIDVAAAKYVIAVCGTFICLVGFRFRRRRLSYTESRDVG